MTADHLELRLSRLTGSVIDLGEVGARVLFEQPVRRLRVFATRGDELSLQNAADACGVKIEIGGVPGDAISPPLPMERVDEEGNKIEPWEWFVAYLHASNAQQVEQVYRAFMAIINQPADRGIRGLREWLSRA